MELLDVFVLGEQIEGLHDWCVSRAKVKGKQGLLTRLNWVALEINRLGFQLETRQLDQWVARLTRYRGTKRLKVNDSIELGEVIHSWRGLIGKELFDRPIMEVHAVNLRPIDLANGPRAFVDPANWRRLSRISRNGLKDATKSLAADAPTASVMVCFRVAEDLVRRYYRFKIGGEAPTSWKETLVQLTKTQGKSIIGHLDYLRDRRNQAEHPDRIFTMEEAERVFMAVVDLIHEIYSEIPPRKIKRRAPSSS
jgi:hypothetical protein